MLTSMNRMYCGNCGTGKFEIYAQDHSPKNGLFAQCANCASATEIRVKPPRLELAWPDEETTKSDGILCFLHEMGKG